MLVWSLLYNAGWYQTHDPPASASWALNKGGHSIKTGLNSNLIKSLLLDLNVSCLLSYVVSEGCPTSSFTTGLSRPVTIISRQHETVTYCHQILLLLFSDYSSFLNSFRCRISWCAELDQWPMFFGFFYKINYLYMRLKKKKKKPTKLSKELVSLIRIKWDNTAELGPGTLWS